ncbi:MAG: pyrroline-5-carboxylate reductase [Betaproteobacteria bacterium]|jgi:pyrroline-5-carboxylate reductase|nr:pyrroline-5-carboxylate reductase [Betaproteobacteria bacterium]
MNILFIGGGNMAAAIIGGLIAGKWPPESLQVVDMMPGLPAELERRFGIRASANANTAAADADCIVFAVKPQHLRAAAQALAPAIRNQLIISIAAGIRCRDLARWLGTAAPIVRAMPNTPALVAAGVTGLYAMPGVTAQQRDQAAQILGAVGTTFWVDAESDLDAVTAVSGSGPAYVFYFIEALEQAAVELGLSPEVARQSALATFAGAVKLASSGDADPATLRARVTSKGGTTERAIGMLDNDAIKAAFARAVRAAAERAAEMGDTLGKD